MRPILAALAPLLLLLAGCVTPPADTSTPPTNTTNGTTTMGPLPPPINDTKQVQGSADPLNIPTGAPCTTPTAQCFRYPFEINGSAHITATLSWTSPSSDFDFYVYQGSTQVVAGANAPTSPGGTSEKIDSDLEPGKYDLVVVAWAVAQDTYKLAANFTAPTG